MKFKHTDGNWEFRENVNSPAKEFFVAKEKGAALCLVYDNNGTVKSREEAKANALVMAAAKEGLRVAIKTYVTILQTPTEMWRIENQILYANLRDYIAEATGYSSQDIQEFYEQVALLIKYEKLSFDEAVKEVENPTRTPKVYVNK